MGPTLSPSLLPVSHTGKHRTAERSEPRHAVCRVSPDAHRQTQHRSWDWQAINKQSICLQLYPGYINSNNKVANTVNSFICSFVFFGFNYPWSKSIKQKIPEKNYHRFKITYYTVFTQMHYFAFSSCQSLTMLTYKSNYDVNTYVQRKQAHGPWNHL